MTNDRSQAQVYTFFPVAGGAGVTTLAIETAMLLLKSESKRLASTCLIDLDFHGSAIADYLDIEPRLNLDEIGPPERLDSQIVEVMTSKHVSGLAVIAAPHRPSEKHSLDQRVVLRLLDLISAKFKFLVIDLPRGWFSWTDNVLLGSDKLFVVSRASVPSLRRTQELMATTSERANSEGSHQLLRAAGAELEFAPQ